MISHCNTILLNYIHSFTLDITFTIGVTLTSETMANRNHPSQAGVQQLMANLPGE